MGGKGPNELTEELFRLRSEKYLKHIRSKPCLVCGGQSEAHHLTFAQQRAKGIKNGDQFAVPMCHTHHMEMHNFAGGEKTFWAYHGIRPLVWAENEYEQWRQGNVDTEWSHRSDRQSDEPAT